jgi:hypothetical protein
VKAQTKKGKKQPDAKKPETKPEKIKSASSDQSEIEKKVKDPVQDN